MERAKPNDKGEYERRAKGGEKVLAEPGQGKDLFMNRE